MQSNEFDSVNLFNSECTELDLSQCGQVFRPTQELQNFGDGNTGRGIEYTTDDNNYKENANEQRQNCDKKKYEFRAAEPGIEMYDATKQEENKFWRAGSDYEEDEEQFECTDETSNYDQRSNASTGNDESTIFEISNMGKNEYDTEFNGQGEFFRNLDYNIRLEKGNGRTDFLSDHEYNFDFHEYRIEQNVNIFCIFLLYILYFKFINYFFRLHPQKWMN